MSEQAVLYTNPSGKPVTTHSYSSGQLFRGCAYKYKLEKIDGIRRKDNSAALHFGRAFESALQFYHQNGLNVDTAVDEYKRLILAIKDVPDLQYTKSEGDFSAIYRSGAEMIRLYHVTLPTLPIKDPVFQVNYKKTVFPGTHLDGLEDQGFVDMVSRSDWVHPMLPKVSIPKGATHRPVLLDIKTSGVGLNTTPDLLSLDSQLLRYASLSGLQDVGFLWFQKSLPKSYRSGVEFTVLEESGKWTPGLRGVVFEYDEETETATACFLHELDKIKEQLSEIKGKGSTERKETKIGEWLADGTLTKIHIDKITKQRLQFVVVRLDPENILDAGKAAAKEIVDIHAANISGYWPKNNGVRYPHAPCPSCSHRGICLKNDRLKEELLVQITNPVDDWLDEVGLEEE